MAVIAPPPPTKPSPKPRPHPQPLSRSGEGSRKCPKVPHPKGEGLWGEVQGCVCDLLSLDIINLGAEVFQFGIHSGVLGRGGGGFSSGQLGLVNGAA